MTAMPPITADRLVADDEGRVFLRDDNGQLVPPDIGRFLYAKCADPNVRRWVDAEVARRRRKPLGLGAKYGGRE